MKDRLYNDATFATMDMGNGWFVAQVTNIIQTKFDDSSNIKQYDFLVGWTKGSNVELYDTTECATEMLANKHGIMFDKDEKGKTLPRIKKIVSVSNFNSFLLECINETIYPDKEKHVFNKLIRVN